MEWDGHMQYTNICNIQYRVLKNDSEYAQRRLDKFIENLDKEVVNIKKDRETNNKHNQSEMNTLEEITAGRWSNLKDKSTKNTQAEQYKEG